MTSNVTITAHTGEDKVVLVTTQNEGVENKTILSEGESIDLIFYDDISVTAKEIDAEEPR